MTASTVVDDALDAICARLAADLVKHLAAYEQAKATFRAVTAAYVDKHGPAIGELRAAEDPRRVKAARDCTWLHGEAMLAATSLLALRGEQQRGATL